MDICGVFMPKFMLLFSDNLLDLLDLLDDNLLFALVF